MESNFDVGQSKDIEAPLITLKNDKIIAAINKSNFQLCSLLFGGSEFIWPGGKPDFEGQGWKNSEILMFPIVGPPLVVNAERVNSIKVKGTEYPMGTHGGSRDIGWLDINQSEKSVFATQKYTENQLVTSKRSNFSFPFSFELTKRISLVGNLLVYEVTIRNESTNPMPYSLGLHPAFKVFEEVTIRLSGKEYSVDKIAEELNQQGKQDITILVKNAGKVEYFSLGKRMFSLESNFENLQIWVQMLEKKPALVALEPITAPGESPDTQEIFEKPGTLLLAARSSITYKAKLSFDEPQIKS